MRFTWQKTDASPEKLSEFLRKRGLSRRLLTTIKHGQGALLAAGKKRQPTYVLNRPTKVTVIWDAEPSDAAVAACSQPLVVDYEDDNWLVVNKPAFMSSVVGPSNRTTTLVNCIKGHLLAANAPNLRPHLLSRLDRDTSGVVLVAKHRVAQSLAVYPPFQEQSRKYYLAIVAGKVAATGEFTAPLAPAADGIHQEVNPNGKPARTRFVRLDATAAASLVAVQLHTGRTHQIRVHFAAAGHPLLGDKLYGSSHTDVLQRQALHAAFVQWYDGFTGQKRQVSAPLPADMTAQLAACDLSLPADWLAKIAK